MGEWRVLANEYLLYEDQQAWLIADDDRNVFEVRTSGKGSTAQDAFCFRDDGGALGGKIMSWRFVGKRDI